MEPLPGSGQGEGGRGEGAGVRTNLGSRCPHTGHPGHSHQNTSSLAAPCLERRDWARLIFTPCSTPPPAPTSPPYLSSDLTPSLESPSPLPPTQVSSAGFGDSSGESSGISGGGWGVGGTTPAAQRGGRGAREREQSSRGEGGGRIGVASQPPAPRGLTVQLTQEHGHRHRWGAGGPGGPRMGMATGGHSQGPLDIGLDSWAL